MIIRRIAAVIVDICVAALVSILAWEAIKLAFDFQPSHTVDDLLLYACFWCSLFIYSSASAAITRATLGKFVLHMRIESSRSACVSFRQIFFREALKLVEVALAPFSLFLILKSSEHQSLSDIVAGTRVIRIVN